MEEKNIVSRPVWNSCIKGKRAKTWFRRSVSAYDLAARIDPEVTEEAQAAAATDPNLYMLHYFD